MTTTESQPSTEPAATENQPVPQSIGAGASGRSDIAASTVETQVTEPSTALVVRERNMAALPPGELLAQVQAWGKLMAASGYFKDARSEAQAAVKVLYGLELGFTPGASMAGVHIIEGRPTLSASLQAQALRRSGRYDYRVLAHDNEHCLLEFYEIRNGEARTLGTSEFSMDDADRAGIANHDNWRRYPRNMLFARSMTNGITFYCPDAFEVGRVYTPDELKPDLNLTSDGSVIDIGSITVEPTPEPRQPRSQQRQERQQRQDRSPRVEQNPTEEPSPDAIANVGQLLTYGINLRRFHGLAPDPGASLKALGVEIIGEISGKYSGNWAEAAKKIRSAFVPTAEHVAPDADTQAAAEDEGLDEQVGALSDEQRAVYEGFIADGVAPEDALTMLAAQ